MKKKEKKEKQSKSCKQWLITIKEPTRIHVEYF